MPFLSANQVEPTESKHQRNWCQNHTFLALIPGEHLGIVGVAFLIPRNPS